MDEARLQDLVDRLGEDFGRWPDDERLAAEMLIVASPKARAIVDQARSMKMAFQDLPHPPPRPTLAFRIVSLADDTAAENESSETPSVSTVAGKAGVSEG